MICNPRNDRGFTLIELVAVVVVLAILSAFTFAFIEHAVKTYKIGSRDVMLHHDGSHAMELLTRELRDMVNPTLWAVGTTSDTLEITKRNSTPMDINTAITFSRDTSNNNLYRSSGGVQRLIARNVTKFDITRLNTGVCNKMLTILLTLEDGDESISLNSTIVPRNLDSSYTDRCFNGDYEDVVQ